MTNTVEIFTLDAAGLKAFQALVQAKQIITINTYVDPELGPTALVQYTQ